MLIKIEIDKDYIIRCISNYETLLKELRDRIQQLYTNIATTGDVLESLQTKARKDKWTGITPGHEKKKDLGDLLGFYVESERLYAEYLQGYIQEIMAQEAALKRVWFCYQALPYIQRKILTDLYVNKKAWKVVHREQGMSITTVKNIRAEGLQNIKRMYDSDLTDIQIMAMPRTVTAAPSDNDAGEQISIWSFLSETNKQNFS